MRLIAFATLLSVVSANAQTGARKSVLIVLPDPPGRPLSNAVFDGIQTELRKPGHNIAVSADYISQVPKDQPEFGAAQLSWYRTKYSTVKFDAIVAVGPQALVALLRLRQDLWPTVPLIWCALDPDTAKRVGRPPLSTGVTLDLEGGLAQRTAMRLLPNAKHMALVGGSSPTDRMMNNGIIASAREIASALDFIDLTNLPLEELKKRLAKLPPDTFVIVNSYFYDPAGRPMFMRDLMEAIAPVSNSPIFEGSEFALGAGTVGGQMHHYPTIGAEAAQMAARILGGEDPAKIPVAKTQSSGFEFDWRQLRKWNIPLDRLPPGSHIHFREETVWERFRWWIAGTLLFAAVESLLIAILLVARRRGLRSEALNSAILASLPGQTFIIDREGVIIRSNQRENIPMALYGREWTNVPGIAPSDAARIRSSLAAVLVGDLKRPVIEFPYRHDGHDQWIEIRIEALDRPEGGAVISHLDITAGKSAEIEARRSKEEILHLNRIASMGELAASLAHELNQPLAGILTNAQGAIRFLGQAEPDYGEVRAALADIRDDGTRAGEVIRKMRNMLKTGTAQSLPLSLNEVAQEAVALLHPDAHLRKISIHLELDPELPSIEGDTIQLQQVIMNLVLNAMEAVTEASKADSSQIEVRSRASGDGRRAEIYVSDQGLGIPPESLSRVFQPFFSTKSDGLGMGLSISRSIVEAHGGTIDVESVPGSGATFRISFPATL